MGFQESLFKKYPWTLRAFVSKEYKNEIFENLSTLIIAGVSVGEALKALEENENNTAKRYLINLIRIDIEDGEQLWKSLKKYNLIAEYLVPILKIGEQSGNLPTQLELIVTQIKKSKELASKIRSASLYPGLILSIGLVVGTVISIFLLPQISGIYENLGVELNSLTQAIVDFGEYMENNYQVVVPLFFSSLFGIFYFIFINPSTKYIGQYILLHTPVIKNIIKKVEMSRFGFLFGILQDSGFPIDKSLSLLSESTSFRTYKQIYEEMENNVLAGYNFQESFKNIKNFDEYVSVYAKQLIITAEKTGNLGEGLHKIGVRYNKETEVAIKNLTTLMEPVLLIVIWIGVAGLAFAIIVPIYDYIGNISEYSNPQYGVEEEPTIETNE